ncbi:MAG: PilZ domain-containing protein [Planctomycetota bacterium]
MSAESVSQRVPTPREGDERRHHPRASVDWPIAIALEGGVHQARLRDVSRSGVSFYIEHRVPEMTLLRLELEVPGGDKRVRGTGVVVRCRQLSPAVEHYEVAVFLNEMDDEEREVLASLVNRAFSEE